MPLVKINLRRGRSTVENECDEASVQDALVNNLGVPKPPATSCRHEREPRLAGVMGVDDAFSEIAPAKISFWPGPRAAG